MGHTHTLLPMKVTQARVFALPGNAVFLVGPNMDQTSTQGEVNGEGLQQQKKHESVHTTTEGLRFDIVLKLSVY